MEYSYLVFCYIGKYFTKFTPWTIALILEEITIPVVRSLSLLLR